MQDKSPAQLIAEAKQRIREVRVAEVKAMRASGDPVVLLDVREPMEWNLGRIPGSVHIPLGVVESKIAAAAPRDAHIVIYCARGNRSALAADQLQNMGYRNVSSMAGGWVEWAQGGGEVED